MGVARELTAGEPSFPCPSPSEQVHGADVEAAILGHSLDCERDRRPWHHEWRAPRDTHASSVPASSVTDPEAHDAAREAIGLATTPSQATPIRCDPSLSSLVPCPANQCNAPSVLSLHSGLDTGTSSALTTRRRWQCWRWQATPGSAGCASRCFVRLPAPGLRSGGGRGHGADGGVVLLGGVRGLGEGRALPRRDCRRLWSPLPRAHYVRPSTLRAAQDAATLPTPFWATESAQGFPRRAAHGATQVRAGVVGSFTGVHAVAWG